MSGKSRTKVCRGVQTVSTRFDIFENKGKIVCWNIDTHSASFRLFSKLSTISTELCKPVQMECRIFRRQSKLSNEFRAKVDSPQNFNLSLELKFWRLTRIKFRSSYFLPCFVLALSWLCLRNVAVLCIIELSCLKTSILLTECFTLSR